jgi:hypothetical protein
MARERPDPRWHGSKAEGHEGAKRSRHGLLQVKDDSHWEGDTWHVGGETQWRGWNAASSGETAKMGKDTACNCQRLQFLSTIYSIEGSQQKRVWSAWGFEGSLTAMLREALAGGGGRVAGWGPSRVTSEEAGWAIQIREDSGNSGGTIYRYDEVLPCCPGWPWTPGFQQSSASLSWDCRSMPSCPALGKYFRLSHQSLLIAWRMGRRDREDAVWPGKGKDRVATYWGGLWHVCIWKVEIYSVFEQVKFEVPNG